MLYPLRGSFVLRYNPDNPSVSYADSSLYTREPVVWVHFLGAAVVLGTDFRPLFPTLSV